MRIFSPQRFLERVEGRGRDTEREALMWDISVGCLLYVPWQGLGIKPATVSLTEIKLDILQSMGCCSNHWVLAGVSYMLEAWCMNLCTGGVPRPGWQSGLMRAIRADWCDWSWLTWGMDCKRLAGHGRLAVGTHWPLGAAPALNICPLVVSALS